MVVSVYAYGRSPRIFMVASKSVLILDHGRGLSRQRPRNELFRWYPWFPDEPEFPWEERLL